MPTEMFLSCVGDLATFGGPVGRDLGPAIPWFVFSFLSHFFCCPRFLWGVERFTLAAPLRCDRVEFLRCGDGNKTCEPSLSGQQQEVGTLAVWTDTRPERKCIAGLFGVLF